MPTAPGPVPLPDAWPAQVRAALLHAFALAHLGIVHVHTWCVNSPIARVRLAADNERLRAEIGLLHEELRIKDARMAKIPARERPHYHRPSGSRFCSSKPHAAGRQSKWRGAFC